MTYSTLTSSLTMRPASVGDAAAIARVAQLDSAPVPTGAVLLGLIDDRIVAAISVDDGRTVADPFVRTADLVTLLRGRVHAIQVAAKRGRGGRPVVARLRYVRHPFVG